MNKIEVLTALEGGREAFLDALEGLSPEEMLLPELDGGWSVKDLLAHLSRWEAELIKLLWEAQQGVRPSTAHFFGQEVDAINAQWQHEMASRPLTHVLEDFHAVRNQTILRVEALSERDLTDIRRYRWLGDRTLAEWVAGDSFEHEIEHLEQVKRWREQRHPGIMNGQADTSA